MENKQPHPLIKAVLDALSGGAAGLPPMAPTPPAASASAAPHGWPTDPYDPAIQNLDQPKPAINPAALQTAGVKQAPGEMEALYGPQDGSVFADPDKMNGVAGTEDEEDLPAAVKKARGSNGPK